MWNRDEVLNGEILFFLSSFSLKQSCQFGEKEERTEKAQTA